MDLNQILTSDGFIATVGALFGGAGARILDKTLSRKSDHYSEAERLRSELREEIDSLRKQVAELETEVVTWRERYWKFFEESAHLRAELDRLKSTTQE